MLLPSESARAMESAAPQYSDIERVVISHLVAMPARAFAESDDDALPAGAAAAPDPVREGLHDVRRHVAQAAAVARLACASRAGNELAKGSALPAAVRSVRHAKLAALCDAVAFMSKAEMLDQPDLQAVLVALCTHAHQSSPSSYVSAGWRDKAAGWRDIVVLLRWLCCTRRGTLPAELTALRCWVEGQTS